jgi:hypothetical protein
MNLKGMHLSCSGVKLVSLLFYSVLDIYYLQKIKNYETIELKRSARYGGTKVVSPICLSMRTSLDGTYPLTDCAIGDAT